MRFTISENSLQWEQILQDLISLPAEKGGKTENDTVSLPESVFIPLTLRCRALGNREYLVIIRDNFC